MCVCGGGGGGGQYQAKPVRKYSQCVLPSSACVCHPSLKFVFCVIMSQESKQTLLFDMASARAPNDTEPVDMIVHGSVSVLHNGAGQFGIYKLYV